MQHHQRQKHQKMQWCPGIKQLTTIHQNFGVAEFNVAGSVFSLKQTPHPPKLIAILFFGGKTPSASGYCWFRDLPLVRQSFGTWWIPTWRKTHEKHTVGVEPTGTSENPFSIPSGWLNLAVGSTPGPEI